MIKNFIFDFGQVIVRFDPVYMTSRYINDAEDIETVSEVVFDRIYWDRLDAGTISDDEIKADIARRLPERLLSDAIKVYDNWYYNIPLIDGIKELISELKAEGKKLYLLSNISIPFAENYHNNPEIEAVLSMFDGLVFSGPLGIVKPDRTIFDHLVSKFGISKEESVFIDDSEKNISGAATAGIKGYLFDGNTEKLRKELLTL